MAEAEKETETEIDEEQAAELAAQRKAAMKSMMQVVGLILLLFLLMTTSVVTALMATGIIDVTSTTSGPANTMTDAVHICDKALQADHGQNLQLFTLDDLSSHQDERTGGFRLYYEMTKYRDDSHQTGVNKFYINCFVTASGRIKRMELFEEKDYRPKAGKRTSGNAIGL